MPVTQDFTSVPILDYDLVKTDKPKFLAQLRHALIYVGFLYLSNPPVSPIVISSVISYIPRLFELPQEAKDSLTKLNSPHFLGYSSFGTELTKGAMDQREQFDFASPHTCRWTPGAPDFLKLWGDSQWPNEELIPGFRETMETYISQVEDLSFEFASLLAEALGLPSDALDRFYDSPKKSMQQRCKIVKYPGVTAEASKQGVGPHYDAGFLTFLLQASPHEGLQVQNFRGDWIPASPIPNTFIVNIGKALEAATRGAAIATTHRVVSPPIGSGARYSVPLFQNISQHVRMSEEVLELPEEITTLVRARGRATTDSVNFSEYDTEQSGLVTLIGRVKSHPDVAQRHYPELFAKYFPDGLPALGSAY
ncbi:Clavaminate synthase-like protein [Ramaria rubella]|nr:Clavaminate synthase-like protein [Ramaria rubella]